MNRSKLLVLAYPLLLAGLGNDVNEFNSLTKSKANVKPEWERKKCKSCSLFPCKPYHSPLKQACCKYIKRKGKNK